MDERPQDPPPWLPATRPATPPEATEPAPRAGWGPPEPKRPFEWRRFVRTPRAAVGFGLLAAFLLLWPFSGFSWIPLLAGFGALLVVRILRFDGLLRGWDLPLAGLVVVVGLMWSTSPWAWALAGSIGVLIAGLLQLPEWKVVAIGAVLCLGSGIGFADSLRVTAEQVEQQHQQANERTVALEGERRPDRVIGALLEGIVQDDVVGVCGLLDDRATTQFVVAANAPDCPTAVHSFNRAVAAAPPSYTRLDLQLMQTETAWMLDGCRTAWAKPPLGGPTIGRIEVRETSGKTYFAAAFLPC